MFAFVNKVLLDYSQVRLCVVYSYFVQQQYSLLFMTEITKLKYLLSDPLQKRFADF